MMCEDCVQYFYLFSIHHVQYSCSFISIILFYSVLFFERSENIFNVYFTLNFHFHSFSFKFHGGTE